MQFSQASSAAPRLYVAMGNGDAPPRRLFYLLPASVKKLPAQISFADSWSPQSGVYLFLAQALPAGAEASFAAAAQAFLDDPRLAGSRFVWFEPQGGSPLLTGTAISIYQPDGSTGPATAFTVTFPLQDIGLFVAANTPVAIDTANVCFTFTQQGSRSIYFTVGWGGSALYVLGTTLTLPFIGQFAGCLQFGLNLSVAQQAALDIGLRYYYAVAPDPKRPKAAAADFFLESLGYPLFADPLTLYAALDPLAPLDGTRTVFAFNAADAGRAGGTATGPLTSNLRSTLGDTFTLQPLTGTAAVGGFATLVFAAKPQAAAASGGAPTGLGPRDALCLAPRGDFALALKSGRNGTVDLMCGLSGVEYIELQPEANVMTFIPGCPAFALGFYPGKDPGYTTLTPATPPTTSFARVTARPPDTLVTTLDYYAQPDQSVLHNYGGGLPDSNVPMLAPVQVLAAIVAQDDPPVPLMPYAGLSGGELDPYRQMESQIISPTRRNMIGKPPTAVRPGALSAAASPYSTTPQGLLATYVPGSPVWDEIVLGRSGTTPQDFCLTSVQGDLLSAFQRNKLFLVVSDPNAIKSFLKSTDAQIILGSDPTQPWNFNIAPEGNPSPWTQFGTIMIVKFYDMAVAEVAGQPGSWAFADEFNNQKAAAVSQTIVKLIDAAKQALNKDGDTDFTTFIAAVTEASWNGILILNANAPISNLPPQLAGLAAGIDQSKFYAHHVGINASQIDLGDPKQIQIHNSSVFGLIHYQAPAPLQPYAGDYQFQVTQLKVLFLESDVASFSSTIELEVNTLFDEPATLEGTPDPHNIVQMFGVYQRQMVNGQVSESYSFQTQSGQVSIFDMTSNTLNAVQLNKGQFVTVTQPWKIAGAQRTSGVSTITTASPHTLQPGDSVLIEEVASDTFDGLYQVASVPSATSFTYAQPSEPNEQSSGGMARPTKTDSRFVFWGLLDFKALVGFDAFSFGRESADTAPKGLSVGNLAIEMTFDSAANPPVAQFDFDVSKLSFDLAGSYARQASFFQHFPLTVASFTQAVAGSTPTDLGFMAVQTPLNQSTLSYPWFSLNFNLNLGSPGALAAQEGFVATLTVAWSPSSGGVAPPSAPALSQTAGGTIDATTYYAQITYLTESGETLASLESSLPVSANNLLVVSSPAAPAAASAWNVYAGTSSGSEHLQGPSGALSIGSNWTEPTSGLQTATPTIPSANTSSDYTVFVGLKLPGSSGASREISIEGIFNITFKTLQILTPPDKANTFILVLYGIGFKFLSFTFPPNGQVNFVLFGNPDSPGGNSSLGWYAAYAKTQSTPAGGGNSKKRVAARQLAALEDRRRDV